MKLNRVFVVVLILFLCLKSLRFYFYYVFLNSTPTIGKDNESIKRSAQHLAQCLTDAADTKGLETLKKEYPWL